MMAAGTGAKDIFVLNIPGVQLERLGLLSCCLASKDGSVTLLQRNQNLTVAQTLPMLILSLSYFSAHFW
jgi:hypothetical protein